MKKRFGLTGHKLIDSIDSQLEVAESVKSTRIQTIPVDSVSFAPGNPRDLSITPDDLRKHLDTLQLPPAALQDNSDNNWLEAYEDAVAVTFNDAQKTKELLGIAQFAAALKSPDNLLHPIVVWSEEGHFYKITGERRYLSHLLLKAKNIRATVWDTKPTGLQLARIQWDENNQRENLDLHEELGALENLVDELLSEAGEDADTPISLSQFQNLAGVSRTQAQRYLKVISNGTPKLRQAIVDGRVPALRTAYEFASEPPGRADELLDKLLSGGTVTQKEIRRNRVKSGKRTRKTSTKRTPNFVNPRFQRRMKPQDIKVAGRMISIFKGTFNDSELDSQLENLSMDKAKDVCEAFQKVFDHVKSRAKAAEK